MIITTLLLFLLRATPSYAGMIIGSGGAGDTTPPTLTSSTIPAAGTTISLLFSETVSIGAGGNGGWTLTTTYPAVTMAYSSGSGSNTLVYTLSRTVTQCESLTINYTQPGNGVEDASGNDLANVSGATVTNSSTQVDSGAGYLIFQNFETATTGYDNSESWTETVGTGGIVEAADTTSPIMRQCQQLKIYAGNAGQISYTISPTFTAQDTAYTHFKLRLATSLPSSNVVMAYLRLSTALKQWVQIQTTGALVVNIGPISATSVATISPDTTYHVWMRYTKSSGANDGIGSVGFSTNTTEPTSGDYFATFTNGTVTTQIDNIRLNSAAQATVYFDQVIVDDATIVPLAP